MSWAIATGSRGATAGLLSLLHRVSDLMFAASFAQVGVRRSDGPARVGVHPVASGHFQDGPGLVGGTGMLPFVGRRLI